MAAEDRREAAARAGRLLALAAEHPTPALDLARELGVPDVLFVGLCEWLEGYPVESDYLGTRYGANTRALALRACRTLGTLRDLQLVD